MGKQEDNRYYDKVFAESEHYHKSWEDVSSYYKTLWQRTIKLLQENNINSVLDIGCGMGQMAELTSLNNIKYKGIDFSEYAINHCKEKNLEDHVFECVNALEYEYSDDVEGYITHEFLEHIEGDLFVLAKLKKHTPIIFTVPDFDCPGHVRWFPTIEDVVDRYSFCINGLEVSKVTPRHYLGSGYVK